MTSASKDTASVLTRERRVRAINTLKYLAKMPYRAFRRASIERRLSHLPDGRGWRTAISPALHISIMRGLIDYRYRDIPMQKHPVEIALYLQLIWEAKPRTIFEIGSLAGGSAVWMADTLNSFGIDGRVISIDLTPPSPSYKPRNVAFLQGDQNALAATLPPDFIVTLPRPWLVVEDAAIIMHLRLRSCASSIRSCSLVNTLSSRMGM